MSSVLSRGRSCFRRCCVSPLLNTQVLFVVDRCYPSRASAIATAVTSSSFVPDLGTGAGLFSRSHSSQKMELFRAGSFDKNKGLVEHLRQLGIIRSNVVAEVMETVDRGLFLNDRSSAYVDSPMLIGYNATISAPHMHATCLELLKEHLKPGMRVLDVGSGTGYLTACFALMVGPEGHAVGVDHIPELVVSSIENIKRSAGAELLKGGSLTIHVADGRLGYAELAPFDAIHVGAAAAELPKALVQQLKPGGRMVIPVGKVFQELQVVDKGMDGSVSISTETSVRYVPLTSREAQLQGH